MAENDSHYNGTDSETVIQFPVADQEGWTNPTDNVNTAPDTTIVIPETPNTGTQPVPGNSNTGTQPVPCSPDTGMNLTPWVPDTGMRPTPWVPNTGMCPTPGVSDTGTCPVCGNISAQSYGQVRFLNASANGITVNIFIDGTMYHSNSRFGTLSNYDWISDGFHTVTVQRANGIRSTLLRQTFPFMADQKVTMVLTDSAEGGLEIVRVIDTGCRNLPAGSGCFRFANMTYSGSSLDLLLSGQTIFRNVRFQSVSAYKQAIAGVYQFTAVTSASYGFMRELPVIVLGIIGSSLADRETVFTFSTRIQSGKNYTAYLIGNNWSNTSMRIIIAED